MPKYQIVSQSILSPAGDHRWVRSVDDNGAKATIVDAPSLLEAAKAFEREHANTAVPPRLVSIEELVSTNVETLSDEALTFALRNNDTPFDFDDYEGQKIFSGGDFDSIVEDIADALHNCGLVPGLTVSIQRDDNLAFEWCMLEIHDRATGTYRAAGCGPESLIDDESLTGLAGLLSVARALIEIVQTENLL
ncbi:MULTISPECIES: hypothetical protein [unclassified Microbacterium]|uniref:hypothetical protein n=1 Tax=unclassified Microbacterium TaxID=2609290 RepID=UPI002883533B|nr:MULTISPECIES: hypothetical protein [unclassified Microbacterium]